MFRGLTQTGANYLATRLANALPVKFTKVKIGSGTASGNPYATTNLNNYIQDAKILTKVQEANSINITVQITNENRQQGFYLKEIGVFVDDNGTEKLYWYCNEDNAQYVPTASDSAIAFEIEIKMEVTNQESTILNWSGRGTWIDRDYLEKELAKKEPAFEKKSGFNLDKTDSYEEDDSNKLGTAKALKKLYDCVKKKLATFTTTENLTQLLKGKENTFAKNTSFNKNFGTAAGTVMEGDKYEVIKSIPGTTNDIRFIQDGGVKNKGSFYIDRHTGRICKCIQQTSSTSNDSNYFQDVTLDKLSDRLDNLLTFDLIGIAYCGSFHGRKNYSEPIKLKPGSKNSNTVVLLGLTSQGVGYTVNSISYFIQDEKLYISSTIDPNTQNDTMSYAVKYLF